MSFLLKLLYPPKCIVCSKVLPIQSEAPFVCSGCVKHLPQIPLHICPTCGKPLDVDAAKPYCVYCTRKLTGFTFLISPFYYDEGVRESILRMKFGGCANYAETYAYYLYERIQRYGKLPELDLIVPAPISKNRKKERGYNQAALIAKQLSLRMNVPWEEILLKTKETPPQSTLSAEQRKHNLAGAITFAHPITAKNILLIDDVYTTGSTAYACARALKKAGGKQVYIATVAVHLPLSAGKNQKQELL